MTVIYILERTGFPKGLDQDVGENGSMLSGGQRARVVLARAVYSRALVTVLDDPLCALDPCLRAQVSSSNNDSVAHISRYRTVAITLLYAMTGN